MKRKNTALVMAYALLIAIFINTPALVSAQGPKNSPNTKSPILYHDGAVMAGTADIYLIFYGCWTDSCGSNGSTKTVDVVSQFAQSIGGTTYFQLNALYPNSLGQTPSGGAIFGGAVDDNYSH